MAQLKNVSGDDVNIPAFDLAIAAGETVDVDDMVAAALADTPGMQIVQPPTAPVAPVAEQPAQPAPVA